MMQKIEPATRRRGRSTFEQGGNGFADIHGAYGLMRQIKQGTLDGRTKAARAIKELRMSLYAHVGDRPSPPQAILIERIVNKLPIIEAFERYRLLYSESLSDKTGKDLLGAYAEFLTISLDQRYRQMCDSLRNDLIALGMKNVPKGVTSFEDYLKRGGAVDV